MRFQNPSVPLKTLTLTRQQARRCLLAHQGLWPPFALAGKAGALEYIRRAGCIQFDPLDIAGRNPELVLQARVADFRSAMLEELLYQDRALLDGWDKMMSIYALEDWPYFRRRREDALRHYGHDGRPATEILPQVRQAIATRGPLSSIDLDFNRTVDWAWAPTRIARAALESMYTWGELVIHHKVHTRKVYDFAHRHISHVLLAAPDPNETEAGYHDWYVLRRLGSVGLMWGKGGDAWLGMDGIKGQERQAALARLLEAGKVVTVEVAGLDAPLYMRRADSASLDRALDGEAPPCCAVILAPLDNLLWDRRFIEALFDFRYRWEVYKPVGEREYGYYVLPILYGDRFVARFEPGRDKRNGALIVKNWWWEPGVTPSDEMRAALRDCFARFLALRGLTELRIDRETAERAAIDWLGAL